MDIATFDAAVSATVAAAVQTNGCGTTRVLASGLGLSDLTIRTILHTDWGWYKFPVINAAAAKNWFAAIAIPLIADPPFSPNFAPAYFFLFPKANELLAGLSPRTKSLKKTWGGVSETIIAKTFAAALRRWFERREKCVRIGGDHAEKS